RAIIWGFVGSIFGGLYIAFISMMGVISLGHLVVIPAAAFAGAVGAAFYGSFQVAIVGTLAGAVSGIGYQVLTSNLQTVDMVWISLMCGMLAGYLYGNTHNAVSGALMKALTGLVAGALAGSLLWLISLSGVMVNSFFTGALLVPITGALYIFGIFKIINKLQCKLPLPLVGAVVAGALSVVVAGSIGSVHAAITTSYDVVQPAIHIIDFTQVMGSVLGGAVGGFVAGGVYAWAGLKGLKRQKNEVGV
ncbi:MAG: hypothetical protein OQL20_00525, partial [Sedimenticola sp.]|nr:hypothetical protein [Sedimenticola sp.]